MSYEPTPEQAAMLASLNGTTPFSAVTSEEVDWLWEGRIPFGMLTLLVGDPGLGKSMLTCDLAAKLSRAGAATLLLTAEDSPAVTIKPRLQAAGADLDFVHLPHNRQDGIDEGFSFPDDIEVLDGLVQKEDVRLVVIDPLVAHLGGQVSSWKDQSIRTALAPLYRMATERRCAVVLIVHLNKAQGADPLHRTGGSIGIPGAVRSALLLARDPNDPQGEKGGRRVLAHIKSNLSPLAASLSYEIESVTLSGEKPIHTARLKLLGESDETGQGLLAAPDNAEQRSAMDEAVEFLEAELAEGERESREVQSAARAIGISERTLKRAKHALKVEAERVGEGGRHGGGHWVWRLPPVKGATVKEANPIPEDGPLNANPLPEREPKGANPLRGPGPLDGPLNPAGDGLAKHGQAEIDRLRDKWGES